MQKYTLNQHESFRICKLEEKLTPEFFASHTHKYFEMIIFSECESTSLEHSIDFIAYPIVQNRIYFISENQTHQWLLDAYKEEFKGYFITFNTSFIKSEETLLNLFDFLRHAPFIDLSPDEISTVTKLIKMIESEDTNNKYIQSLLEALLHYLADKRKSTTIMISPDKQRFIQLRTLIEKYYKKEKQASFYAKKIGISSKRLNEVIKNISEKSITQLIHQRILLQAKRELSLKDKTIQDIAYELGFDDPTYFSRFFKKMQNQSPSEFLGK